jgi:hypothetical protein
MHSAKLPLLAVLAVLAPVLARGQAGAGGRKGEWRERGAPESEASGS